MSSNVYQKDSKLDSASGNPNLAVPGPKTDNGIAVTVPAGGFTLIGLGTVTTSFNVTVTNGTNQNVTAIYAFLPEGASGTTATLQTLPVPGQGSPTAPVPSGVQPVSFYFQNDTSVALGVSYKTS